MIEKFKQLNVNFTGSEFIRKFEWLGKIIKNKNDINLIELILSFQLNNKEFSGTDAYIAHRISLATSSINACLNRLEVEGFIIRKPIFNKKYRRNERTIKVNYDILVNKFEALKIEQQKENVENNPTSNVVVTPAVNPITEVIVTPEAVATPEVNPTPEEIPTPEVIPTKVAIAPPEVDLTIEIRSEPKQAPIIENITIESNKNINEEISTSKYYKPGYEDFNVKKMLTYYLREVKFSDAIKEILNIVDKDFIMYLTKNKIRRKYNLRDFSNHMQTYDYDEIVEIILNALANDIKEIDKFKLVA